MAPTGDGRAPKLDPSISSRENRLDSWKEIAVYLRRGARTVQRWEREEGLPVHRLRHEKLGSIFAYKSELDAWWKRRGAELEHQAAEPDEEPSVAVLPFSDLSREKDQEYFCEGIAEEIVGALSRVAGMRVASRIAAFRFKGAADVAEIGRRLKVRTVLEGSVRKMGERLRVSVRLNNAENGFQVWAETYDREIQDIFAIQAEIANSIARQLEVALSPREKAALRKAPTGNVHAYDCYLRGRKFYYGYGPRDMEYAIQLFTRAISLDPNYAMSYAGLADCWCYLYLYSTRNEILREQAEWASQRAVELDPESAQAHASRAVALSLGGRDEEAEAAFETALRLDPNHFEALYFHARHSFARGENKEAAVWFESAMRVRPEDYQSPLLLAQVYENLSRPEEAAAARRRGIAAAQQHLALNPDDARALYMAANGMVALGERERGRQWAERALAMRPDEPMTLYNIGCIYSLLGLTERAITCLDKAVTSGLTQRGWFENDPNLEPLRRDPRFQALLARLP